MTQVRQFGRRAQYSGFTLMEVLVAMMILGTAIAALFGLLSGSLSNLRRAESARHAAALGRSKLNELLISRGPQTMVQGGPSLRLGETIGGSWDELTRWSARATPIREERSPAVLTFIPVKVDFTVFWRRDEGGKENEMLLETTQLWPRTAPVTGN
jgi:prepilin-type N-terminal cleavage/methylation domain-containing protein